MHFLHSRYEIILVKYFKWALLSATAGRRFVSHYQTILQRKHVWGPFLFHYVAKDTVQMQE